MKLLMAAVIVLCHAALVGGQTVRPLVIQRTSQSVVIDGVPSEACWKTADRRTLRSITSSGLTVGSSAAFCYDDKNLYVAVWLEEPLPERIKAPNVEVNAPEFWAGEVVEWFINSEPDGVEYVQLAWNPAGSRFNARCTAAGGGSAQTDLSWKPRWQMASRIDGKGWITEAAIPFSELGASVPRDGTQWSLNLCRTRQVGKKEYYSLAALNAGGFHQPELFMEISFNQYVPAPITSANRSGPLKALIGCWSSRFGYDSLTNVRRELERALGQDNVEIRVATALDANISNVRNWPKRYAELAKYSLVVITDLPITSLTETQQNDLRRYVKDGGRLLLIGGLAGYKHDPNNNWGNSCLKDLLPIEPSAKSLKCRPVIITAGDNPLFEGIPAGSAITTRTGLTAVKPGATAFANTRLLPGEGSTANPFIAERKTGNGSVVHINAGGYCQNSSVMPIDNLTSDLFQSPWYPIFWDHLIRYLTGRPVPYPAQTPVPSPSPTPTRLSFDLIRDNGGDLFAPAGKIRVHPRFDGKVELPYDAELFVDTPGTAPLSAGSYKVEKLPATWTVSLPYLDRGRYFLRVVARKGDQQVCSHLAPFAVSLPTAAEDEFSFTLFTEPTLDERDSVGLASYLKSIGFTGTSWLGGIVWADYQGMYRLYNEGRFASRMQEAGLQTHPVWYPVLYNIYVPESLPNAASAPRRPSAAYPGKSLLAWNAWWLSLFGEQLYGRMPLTTGYPCGDELTGIWIPESDRLRQGFHAASNTPAPRDARDPNFYNLLNYRLKISSDLIWFVHSTSQAFNPDWTMDSVMTPMSYLGHTSAPVDIPGTCSALGSASPDEYHYGELKLYQKSLKSLAITWSATDFGRRAKTGFTGGQLSNNYYEAFPEQVFAAISGGARSFTIFCHETTNFDLNGRPDAKFAKIARATTTDAGLIGRTLNHYERSRARVALFYPHTAHIIMSMGRKFNPDYLQLSGTSDSYLDLGYAFEAEFELLRRTLGHVDVLFDEQIARGDLGNYDLLVIGYARQIEERTLREARRFVERGGTLLIASDSGRFNQLQAPTGILYDVLPATIGAERKVPVFYSETRMQKPSEWNTGNVLTPRPGTRVLFAFPDQSAACVLGKLGRGETILLGMPLGALRAEANRNYRTELTRVLNDRVSLISRPVDEEFSAITFRSMGDDGRVFMVVNHNKRAATTRVLARGDESEAQWTLADIVTGEKVPFTVKDGVLAFDVTVKDRWGRALALLEKQPAKLELSVSQPMIKAGERLLLAVRILGTDDQPVHATLPFDLTITDPRGKARDDLSGVRIADKGVYVFALSWPVAAAKGKWTATVTDKISNASDTVIWEGQ